MYQLHTITCKHRTSKYLQIWQFFDTSQTCCWAQTCDPKPHLVKNGWSKTFYPLGSSTYCFAQVLLNDP